MLPFFLSGKSCQVIWTIVPSLLPSLLLQSDCPDFEGSAQLGIGMSYSTDFAVFNIVKRIIYIMLLSDLEKLLSVWENVLSIANVT